MKLFEPNTPVTIFQFGDGKEYPAIIKGIAAPADFSNPVPFYIIEYVEISSIWILSLKIGFQRGGIVHSVNDPPGSIVTVLTSGTHNKVIHSISIHITQSGVQTSI